MKPGTPRYARQYVLPEIGEAGQARLAAARVLVIGAGGLGCPALLYLAGAGIGTIGIVDFDKVDRSNLQRQILFTEADIDQPKVLAGQKRLLALNPDINVHAYPVKLDNCNAHELFSAYDIIVDGTDNFAAKYIINDMAVKLERPVVYGAIQGFSAQITVFHAASGPCYRCLHPQKPEAEIMNCAQNGIIGAVAGIAGTVQAMEVIKLVAQHKNLISLIGKLWILDAATMEPHILSIPKNPACPVCSKRKEDIVIKYSSPVCSASMIQDIQCDDARISSSFLIDVREKDEFDAGHIEGAVHLPLSELQKNPNLYIPPADGRDVVLYCARGMRSKKAAEILAAEGHSNLYNMAGGYYAWAQRA